MKKIVTLIIIIAAVCMGNAKAGNVTFSPATFTANDQVTLTVDVSGTPLAGATEAYIWIFSNTTGGTAKDGVTTNTSWTNSPDAAKMVAAGTNKWSFTFIGATLFQQTPGELKDFGFLVKAKDGSKQTPDFKPFFFDPLVFTPSLMRIFPAKVDVTDAVTMYYERTLATTTDGQRMTPVNVVVTGLDENGNQVGNPVTVAVKVVATQIWAGSIIPSDNFVPTAGHKLTSFKYKFNGTLPDTSGNPTIVSSAETTVTFTAMK